MNHLVGFAGVAKKQEVMSAMIANYLTLIQFVEIHIEFHNNNHLDNIMAAAGAAGAKEHIEAVVEHIEAVAGQIEAVAGQIEAVVEHIEAVVEHIEAVAGHIEAVTGHIEDNDIVDIENKNVGYVEEYNHLLLMLP